MQTFEQQQIVQLERRLATLASEFRACENDEQRRDVAHRYEEVLSQLREAPSWCGEPYLDSQLPDEWMPAIDQPESQMTKDSMREVGRWLITAKEFQERIALLDAEMQSNVQERLKRAQECDLEAAKIRAELLRLATERRQLRSEQTNVKSTN